MFTSRLWRRNFRRERFCGGTSLRLRGGKGSRFCRRLRGGTGSSFGGGTGSACCSRFCGGGSSRFCGGTGSRLRSPTSASFKAFVPRVLDAIGSRVSAVAVPGPALPTTREPVFA